MGGKSGDGGLSTRQGVPRMTAKPRSWGRRWEGSSPIASRGTSADMSVLDFWPRATPGPQDPRPSLPPSFHPVLPPSVSFPFLSCSFTAKKRSRALLCADRQERGTLEYNRPQRCLLVYGCTEHSPACLSWEGLILSSRDRTGEAARQTDSGPQSPKISGS